MLRAGRFLVVGNLGSDEVFSLAIDAASGALRPTGHGAAVPRVGTLCFVERTAAGL